ncbi:MAG TPA: Ig-like domain-containing protein, partial [Methylomirabilota bacterium]|nr:Ig-like domain-containing protein [Methylomirabilota bacterium]
MVSLLAYQGSGQYFFTDFEGPLPAGAYIPPGPATDPNEAIVEGGYLKLTRNINSSGGIFYIDDFSAGGPIYGFNAQFDAFLFGSTCCNAGVNPADGFSFNLVPAGSVVANPAYGQPAEEGLNEGLAINFDTWDNGGAEAPAIEVKWLGAVVARVSTQPSQTPNGATTPEQARKHVFINLFPDGTLDLKYGDTVIFQKLPTGYDASVIGTPKWVLGARTGGANDHHWIDNLRIATISPARALIPAVETVWDYNDATTDPGLHGSGWQLPGYDTTSVPGWRSGPQLFGNDSAGIYDLPGYPWAGRGINGFSTPLDRTGGRVTFYLRTKFNWSGATAGVTLTASNWVDDGMIVYLNGTEVSRIRVPDGDVTWSTLGSNPATEGAVEIRTWDSAALVEGENTVAVEVHQSSTGSSDVAFGLDLRAVAPMPPTVTDCFEPTNRIVDANRSTTLRVIAIGSPALSYQWYLNGQPIPGANSAEYAILQMTEADGGEYYCEVSNVNGTAVSRTATVTYRNDTTPPRLAEAIGSATFDKVTVVFNELIDGGTAGDTFNYAVSDGNGNTLNVSAVNVNSDGLSVTLTTDAQTPDTVYTVTVTGVNDAAGNTIVDGDGNSIQFTSWVPTDCGGVLFQAFDTSSTPGNAVSLLTSHPNFPNNPRESITIDRFDSRAAYPDDSHEQYGGRMSGLFIPPSSGKWVFFLRSDDASELWLNPNGADVSGKVRIAQETGCCNAFQPVGNPRTSGQIELQAGRPYYIEALWKEGVGGDYCNVAALPVPASGANPAPPANDASIPGSLMGFGAAPKLVAGEVAITQQPQDVLALENTTATFTVGTSNQFGLTACYQWYRDGAPIPGANGPSYSLMATLADDGAKFSVKVGIIGHSVVSTEATLTINRDTVAPQCVSASGSRSLTNVTLRFNELLDAGTAGDSFNYSYSGGSVVGATLLADGMSVLLSVDTPQTPGASYTVTAQNVTDLAGNAITEPCTVSFNAFVVSCGFVVQENYFNIGGVAVNDLRNSPNFPHNPGLTRYLTSAQINTFDEFDNYGARVSGFVVPAVSGNYHFYMSSDDGGELWLSTDASPANLQLIAFEPTWNGRRDWLGTARRNAAAPENRSSTLFPGGIPLVAGQMYYFEALMK